ncbi:MAG: hypothetical protein ACFBSC_06525 [Microcoleaceae cyanobacterium]
MYDTVYDVPSPPYFLVAVGLFIGIASCTAFITTLKMLIQEWKRHRSSRVLSQMRSLQLVFPFIGTAIGIGIFLASCLQVFAFSAKIAYGFAAPLSIVLAGAVWFQLSQLFNQLEQRGRQAIDLDNLTLGRMIPQVNPPNQDS